MTGLVKQLAGTSPTGGTSTSGNVDSAISLPIKINVDPAALAELPAPVSPTSPPALPQGISAGQRWLVGDKGDILLTNAAKLRVYENAVYYNPKEGGEFVYRPEPKTGEFLLQSNPVPRQVFGLTPSQDASVPNSLSILVAELQRDSNRMILMNPTASRLSPNDRYTVSKAQTGPNRDVNSELIDGLERSKTIPSIRKEELIKGFVQLEQELPGYVLPFSGGEIGYSLLKEKISPADAKKLDQLDSVINDESIDRTERARLKLAFGCLTATAAAEKMRNPESPCVLERRDRYGSTVLDNLVELSSQKLDPEVTKNGITNTNLLTGLCIELSMPEKLVRQGSKGACAAGAEQYLFLKANPGDYTRHITELTAEGRTTVFQNGKTYQLKPEHLVGEGGKHEFLNADQTLTSRIFQATLMEIGNGTSLNYNLLDDQHELSDGTVVRSGTTREGVVEMREMLYGHPGEFIGAKSRSYPWGGCIRFPSMCGSSRPRAVICARKSRPGVSAAISTTG